MSKRRGDLFVCGFCSYGAAHHLCPGVVTNGDQAARQRVACMCPCEKTRGADTCVACDDEAVEIIEVGLDGEAGSVPCCRAHGEALRESLSIFLAAARPRDNYL